MELHIKTLMYLEMAVLCHLKALMQILSAGIEQIHDRPCLRLLLEHKRSVCGDTASIMQQVYCTSVTVRPAAVSLLVRQSMPTLSESIPTQSHVKHM